MTTATAQGWLDVAQFQVKDKDRIAAEVKGCPDAAPEAKFHADNLQLLTRILLMRAVEKYLQSL